MKFKVTVTKTYVEDHIIEAEDADHAKEIVKEISDVRMANSENFVESTWNVTQIGGSDA